MMLARSTLGVNALPNTETEIARWMADGVRELIGFTATGSWSAEFRLYVGSDPAPWYVYLTSPGNRTAYIADRGVKLEPNTVVRLVVYHEGEGVQTFKGTILGG